MESVTNQALRHVFPNGQAWVIIVLQNAVQKGGMRKGMPKNL